MAFGAGRGLAAAMMMAALTVPAGAGWFGSDEPAAKASDDVVQQIQRAVDDQRYVDAGRMLNEAALKAEDDPRLLLLAAEVSLYRGQVEAALNTFKKIDAVAVVRPRALEGEGIALALEGHSEDAVKTLQTAVAADPSAWRAWNALGTECDRRHDWQDAEVAYGHALAASAGNPIVLNNRGFSRLTQNRLDEATADFVAALDKKPDFVPARNNLRLAIAMKGDYDRAIAGANSADRAAILNNAGFVAMLRGDYSTAKDLLGQAMKAKGQYYAMAAANLEATRGLESVPADQHGKTDAAR